MYCKIIAGVRKVISSGQGHVIEMEFDHSEFGHKSGDIVSNPRLELLIADGWEEFTPPVVPPQPQTEPSEYEKVEALNALLATDIVALDDESAIAVKALFTPWIEYVRKQESKADTDPDVIITAGTRVYFDNDLYKCIKDHVPQRTWTPKDAHSLFTKISVEEWPEIPEHIPAENPFNTGDKGTWKGQHYICQMDGCVWNPDEYPAAWILAEQ